MRLLDCLYHKQLLPSAFKVYAFLCYNPEYEKTGVSIEEMCRLLRMSHKTVSSALRSLQHYGFIEIETYRRQGNQSIPNRYTLL